VTTALPYQYFSFFHNNGNGSFGYATLTSGLGKITRLFSGWGMRVFDYDNDGRKDLFVANGHVMDNIEVTQPHLSYRQKPLLLRNLGNTFVNVSSSSGEVFDQAWASRGAAFGDLDNDGDVDIVVSSCDGPVFCLRNEGGNKNHWIGLELHGTQSDRQGIGAKVELTMESGKLHYNAVSTAGSYLSANDPRVVIGLGMEESVRQIVVRWPSGVEQVITTPKPDQYLKLVESASPRLARNAPTPGNSPRQGEEVSQPPWLRGTPGDSSSGAYDHPLTASLPRRRAKTEFLHAFLVRDGWRLEKPPPAAGEGEARNSQTAPGKEPDARSAALAKYRLAESLERQSKIAEAIEALRESIQLSPNFTEAHFVLGVLLARQGSEHYAAAVDQFLVVLRLNPRHLDARINLSNVLEQEGDFVAAASALKEALSIAGDRADLYVMLGQKQGGAEQYQDSIKSFRKALELDPKIPGAHYGLAMTLRSLGDLSAAQTEFEAALKLNPSDALAHYQLGRFLIQQKQPAEAAHHLEEAVRLDPQLADAYAKLGILYRSVGKNVEAEKAYRTAVRLNPKLEKACYGLAQLLQAEGKTEEAQKVFEQVRQLKASSNALAEASSLNAAGVARMNAGELDEALQKFQAARALYPTYAAAAYNQALVLARQEKTTEAIQCFKTAIQLQPGFVLAHYGLGLALRLAGDPSADEQLRKAQLMKKLVPQVGNINKTARPEDPD